MADADAGTKNALIDPRTLGETIKEKVKGLFLDAIPDATWDAMIEGEIKAFFHEQHPLSVNEVEVHDPDRSSYNYRATKKVLQLQADVTPFRALVFEALRPLVSARLQEVLGQEKFATNVLRSWDNSGVEHTEATAGAFFEQMLKEMAPDIVQLMFKGVFAHAADAARRALAEAGHNIV